jgi:lipopolysaccharide transport system ATP-binding protein
MSEPIIRVENVGKCYRIHHQKRERYTALRDVMASKAKGLLRAMKGEKNPTPKDEDFWAVKDVSFEVKQGEVLGIIGRNGAGKSTLLKILSRITEPTKGRITLNGRVASLLEVGTGFHPELTGRENIYLNGAILGMSKMEIRSKFDEIVAFAEVERFLDTPVKRYSSGMYVRLAFAVAAHLEPEILVIDEVLAVGDAQFQKKCLGKMQDVADGGRTVLFVSHNMNAVEQLCTSALLLASGEVISRSDQVTQVVNAYLDHGGAVSEVTVWNAADHRKRPNNPNFTPLRFGLYHGDGSQISSNTSKKDEVWVEIECEIQEFDPALTVGYALYTENGTLLYWSYQTDAPEEHCPSMQKGRMTIRSKIPNFLNEGTYRLELIGGLHCRGWMFEPGTSVPTITLTIQGGLSDSAFWLWKRPGELGPVLNWFIK